MSRVPSGSEASSGCQTDQYNESEWSDFNMRMCAITSRGSSWDSLDRMLLLKACYLYLSLNLCL